MPLPTPKIPMVTLIGGSHDGNHIMVPEGVVDRLVLPVFAAPPGPAWSFHGWQSEMSRIDTYCRHIISTQSPGEPRVLWIHESMSIDRAIDRLLACYVPSN